MVLLYLVSNDLRANCYEVAAGLPPFHFPNPGQVSGGRAPMRDGQALK